MPHGIPKDPNYKPRKQPKEHPFRRNVRGRKYNDEHPDEVDINETSFSGHPPVTQV